MSSTIQLVRRTVTGTVTKAGGNTVTSTFAGSAVTGGVVSVNGKTGSIGLLDIADIDGLTSALAGKQAAAASASQAEMEAGTEAALRMMSPLRVAQAIAALGGTGGGAGSSFVTIAVSGESSIVADSATDTLTIAKGNGILLSTNASTDTLTISVSLGTGATDACAGNDSRLSDARTPTSHAHGNITNAGAIGSTADLPVVTTTSGVLTTSTASAFRGLVSSAQAPLIRSAAVGRPLNDGDFVIAQDPEDEWGDGQNGNYHKGGTYNGKNLYTNANGNFYLRYDTGDPWWTLTDGNEIFAYVASTDAEPPVVGWVSNGAYPDVLITRSTGTAADGGTFCVVGDAAPYALWQLMDSSPVFWTEVSLDGHTHTASEISDSTTVGRAVLTAANPSAITFLRVNANNSVSLLSAGDFLTAIGAAASSHSHGNITSAGAIGSTSGLAVVTTTSGVLTTQAARAPLADVRHVFWPAGAAIPRTTNGAATGTIEAATNDVMYDTFDFDSATDEGVAWVGYLEHWGAGTIKVKPVWTCAAGIGGSNKTVCFAFKGRAYANDDAIDQDGGTPQSSTDTWIADGDIHIGPATAAITIAGTPANGQLLHLQCYRDVSEDDLAGDARLLGVWIEYTEAATEEGAW